MRKTMLLAAALIATLAVPAFAEETVRVPMLNNVYSVEAPAEWIVEQNEHGQARFTPEEGSPYSIVFFPPNPDVEGEIAEYAGIVTGALLGQIGGEIGEEEELDFDGRDGLMFEFAIPADGGTLLGIGMVVDFDGYGVLCLATGPEEDIEEFIEIAGEIMGSYMINEEAVRENADLLQEIADQLVKELAELYQ